MASEITVTFVDGGIFNGFASSYKKDGQIVYYFDFDKKYRVQVSGNEIIMQQYQNTNGAWYNINIITKVDITEIKNGITEEYLKENYYTKAETDDKYVKKSGDTMTGALWFVYDNNSVVITNNAITIYDGVNTKDINIQFYNGNVYIDGSLFLTDGIVSGQVPNNYFALSIDGLSRSANYGEPFKFNSPTAFYARVDLLQWMYIRDYSDGTVSAIIDNAGNWQIYNNNQIVFNDHAYGGSGGWCAIGGTRIEGSSALTSDIKLVLNKGATSYGNIEVNNDNGSSGNTVLSAGNIVVYSSMNNQNTQRSEITGNGFFHRYDYSGTYMWLSYRYQRYVNSGQVRSEIADTGIDIYNGGGVTYHSGAAGTTEQYTRMKNNAITMYNTNGETFTINTNNAALTLQSLLGNGATAIRINAPSGHYTLSESGGSVTGTGLYTACNNTFYGESMLNALNQVLVQIMQNINLTYYVTFSGTSFSAGGGISRGGGVGRR